MPYIRMLTVLSVMIILSFNLMLPEEHASPITEAHAETFVASSSEPSSITPFQQSIIKNFLNVRFKSSNVVYNFFKTKYYPNYIIQCFTSNDKKDPSRTFYYIILVAEHEVEWIYPLGEIEKEDKNDRYYYKDCSNSTL